MTDPMLSGRCATFSMNHRPNSFRGICHPFACSSVIGFVVWNLSERSLANYLDFQIDACVCPANVIWTRELSIQHTYPPNDTVLSTRSAHSNWNIFLFFLKTAYSEKQRSAEQCRKRMNIYKQFVSSFCFFHHVSISSEVPTTVSYQKIKERKKHTQIEEKKEKISMKNEKISGSDITKHTSIRTYGATAIWNESDQPLTERGPFTAKFQ